MYLKFNDTICIPIFSRAHKFDGKDKISFYFSNQWCNFFFFASDEKFNRVDLIKFNDTIKNKTHVSENSRYLTTVMYFII